MNILSNNRLTVIIPFLNEGKEVYNTVKNLRENSDEQFDILLINDASSDGFDYRQIAIDFQAQYIEHTERKGVAASRDEGVDLCSTECFLLLDGHMRVFQKDWVTIILSELQKDKRALFCCKTMRLNTNGEITPDAANAFGFGAYIDFSNLSVQWIHKDLWIEESVCDIPCVLGASYACNKTYWQYLKGLHGLESYGMDEQLISIKVWLEGGRCRLLKTIAFGHIFRTLEKVPYAVNANDYTYNKLYIIELFLGGIQNKIELLKRIRKENGAERFNEVVELLVRKKTEIMNEKKYYKEITNRDIDFICDQNTKIDKKLNNQL